MQVYVVTVQGRFVDVFASIEEAQELKTSLYMGGSDGVSITPKSL